MQVTKKPGKNSWARTKSLRINKVHRHHKERHKYKISCRTGDYFKASAVEHQSQTTITKNTQCTIVTIRNKTWLQSFTAETATMYGTHALWVLKRHTNTHLKTSSCKSRDSIATRSTRYVRDPHTDRPRQWQGGDKTGKKKYDAQERRQTRKDMIK